MEIEHCYPYLPYLPDGVESGLEDLEALRARQEVAGQIVQAAHTASRMRCFLYFWMPDARQPSIFGVFS